MAATARQRPLILRKEISREEIVRFSRHQIVQHIVLMVSFILLAITGLPLKFNYWGVSQWWIALWGGVEITREVHRFAAYAMVVDCVYHFLYLIVTVGFMRRPFPVKILPSLKDFTNMVHEIGFFVGLKKDRPKFDRYTWRDKFDYWAIFWGMPVMVGSGFVLAYPVLVTRFLPGWTVPIALVAHSDEAVLAVAWIAIVHIIFNHFDPRVFPLNKSIFTGKVARERYKDEHPLEYAEWFPAPTPAPAEPPQDEVKQGEAI